MWRCPDCGVVKEVSVVDYEGQKRIACDICGEIIIGDIEEEL